MDIGPENDGPGFPESSREQWEAVAAKALGGKSSAEALVSQDDDGIAVDPLAPRTAGVPIVGSRSGPSWTIVQRVDDPDLERATAQLRDDIAHGATGIALVFEGAPNAFGYGLPCTGAAIDAIVDMVPLARMHLRVDPHVHNRTSAEALAAALVRRRADISKLSLSFGIDPAATFASSGGLRMSIEAVYASMPQSLGHFFAMGAPGILLEADGRVFHNAGATEAQELGAMIASAAFYLRMFADARQPLVYSIPHIGFSLSVDQDQFLSMAKVRALRKLWARIQEACGVSAMPTSIHAETSYRMLTAKDAETNILRSTIAAFAAATGGADTISVLPHTISHGLPAAFARRVARNTQIVMADESHVGFVADPSAGAGAAEALTEALCQSAWREFQTIEGEGGVLKSLASGHIQARIAAARTARTEVYRNGGRAIVGTTLFPLKAQRGVETLSAPMRSVAVDAVATCQPLVASRVDELVGAAA